MTFNEKDIDNSKGLFPPTSPQYNVNNYIDDEEEDLPLVLNQDR